MISVMPAKAPPLYPSQSRLLRALGQRLREARLRRRFTVTQVAERAAVSRPTLNKVEQGDASVTMGTYLRVLVVLGLENDMDLLAGEDPVGRRLQDAELSVPRRAPKRKKPVDSVEATDSRDESGTGDTSPPIVGGAS
jgi:transcriptional regulator with XRE-family HTH domain